MSDPMFSDPNAPKAPEPRRPLRPLAAILRARERGENPDLIEKENLHARHERMRDAAQGRAESRLLVLGLFFVLAFGTVAVRMGSLASAPPAEPRLASGAVISGSRADITDREGRVLATNLETRALYAHPHEMVDIPRAARELARIFPEMDQERVEKRLLSGRKFIWLRKTLSPEQVQMVHEVGEPGLLFAARQMRVYPNGPLAAHILGGASFGDEGVRAAEVIGVAGVERAFDGQLRDPKHTGKPLALSIDVKVQATMREVLAGGMTMFDAKGASAVIMDVHTGEILAMSSLPDFDPNDRPPLPSSGDQADSPLFNRAVQGVYELGSVFKIFAMAQALEERLLLPQTMVNTTQPLTWGKFRIRDFKDYGPQLSAVDVIVKSSNTGTARVAQLIGAQRQKAFLGDLGFLEATPVELFEAPSGRPLLPKKWGEIQTMTISYGHGLSTSPLHLAAGYASLLNGGTKVTPTLLKQSGRQLGPRVVSQETSHAARDMLRQVVVRGTATFGEVPGYGVGGKTGTADKPKPNGGYYKKKVLATFASVYPAHDPKYAVVVTLDEGKTKILGKERRTAGWIAVPVAAELIRRTAPLLGVRPEIEPEVATELVQARR
ncbi:MAG: penicillin-binding protein 2 [Mangrovicoccus sp.]|nr:penicillin-binding protein 2 [Mangrovicoccus sp.]